MKKTLLSSIIAGLIAGAFFVSMAYDGKHLNAISASIHWTHVGWEHGDVAKCGDGDFLEDGSLTVYKIQDGKVMSADTIWNRTAGLATYCAFNLSGTKIAFYLAGKAVGTGTSCVTVNGGMNYLATINVDGTGLNKLLEMPVRPTSGEDCPLDWPAGNWIYYYKPNATCGSATNNSDLWRVNASTGENQHVCQLTGNACDDGRRLTLTADASRMAIQGAGGNSIWNVPAPLCDYGGKPHTVCGRPGCNIAISPTGAVVGSYFAGSHDDCFVNAANCSDPAGPGNVGDFRIADMEAWTGESIGHGAEKIIWSANSDKWVLQQIGNNADGHAAAQVFGSNQVAADWVDKVAINITKNPNCDQCVFRQNNTTGDLWVLDPANNPLRNKVENLQGVWNEVPGAIPTPVLWEANPHAAVDAAFSRVSDRELDIRLPRGERSVVSVLDLHGRIVKQSWPDGPVRLSLGALPAGAYFVTARSRTASHLGTVMVR